jgi:hypothetical protein
MVLAGDAVRHTAVLQDTRTSNSHPSPAAESVHGGASRPLHRCSLRRYTCWPLEVCAGRTIYPFPPAAEHKAPPYALGGTTPSRSYYAGYVASHPSPDGSSLLPWTSLPGSTGLLSLRIYIYEQPSIAAFIRHPQQPSAIAKRIAKHSAASSPAWACFALFGGDQHIIETIYKKGKNKGHAFDAKAAALLQCPPQLSLTTLMRRLLRVARGSRALASPPSCARSITLGRVRDSQLSGRLSQGYGGHLREDM